MLAFRLVFLPVMISDSNWNYLGSSLMIVGLLEILSFLHTSQFLMTFYMSILLVWLLWRLTQG